MFQRSRLTRIVSNAIVNRLFKVTTKKEHVETLKLALFSVQRFFKAANRVVAVGYIRLIRWCFLAKNKRMTGKIVPTDRTLGLALSTYLTRPATSTLYQFRQRNHNASYRNSQFGTARDEMNTCSKKNPSNLGSVFLHTYTY